MDLLEFYQAEEGFLREVIRDVFLNGVWVNAFLEEETHGYIHGDRVRNGSLKLLENLTDDERARLIREASNFDGQDPLRSASAVVEICSLLHDCGRFDDKGNQTEDSNKIHHITGAERAIHFCAALNLDQILPYVEDTILCHDFQSPDDTPSLDAPSYMIGRIVQASDQMGWMHPGSVDRTVKYSVVVDRPIFDPSVPLNDRIGWQPFVDDALDALTVLLKQLYGNTGPDRFGVEAAKIKVDGYRSQMRAGIQALADREGFRSELDELMQVYDQLPGQ